MASKIPNMSKQGRNM